MIIKTKSPIGIIIELIIAIAKTIGIKAGDQITAITIKGKEYPITRYHQLVDLVWLIEEGDIVSFTIKGKTEKLSASITANTTVNITVKIFIVFAITLLYQRFCELTIIFTLF